MGVIDLLDIVGGSCVCRIEVAIKIGINKSIVINNYSY